jgi:hypothetical protein
VADISDSDPVADFIIRNHQKPVTLKKAFFMGILIGVISLFVALRMAYVG